ncbi:MAG: dethiobiotin synthase [Polyangiaceae bacterium]|nr:dethiobiotin synthase [Polyangiaceae bacterium]MCW5790072.1 dethiobiotin synthase [Polyangiaceae bacterium]
MKGCVVLGAGTGLGKTYLACALARAARERGTTRALKPVETGVPHAAVSRETSRSAADAQALADAAGHPYIAPHRSLELPASPHLATPESHPIDLDAALEWTREAAAGADYVVVETAGGAFTPVNLQQYNIDLAARLSNALNLPWLLVVEDRLGTLHDALAVLWGATARQAPAPVALVVSHVTDHPPGLGNAHELTRLQPAPVFDLKHGTSPDVALIELLFG